MDLISIFFCKETQQYRFINFFQNVRIKYVLGLKIATKQCFFKLLMNDLSLMRGSMFLTQFVLKLVFYQERWSDY